MEREPGAPWTTKQLAAKVNLSKVHIRRLLASDKLEGRKVGRDWIISDEEAQRFIAERREKWSKY